MSVISTLIRQILEECKLRQKDLAEVLEVPLDRVKQLATGRVQKLTREEGVALITKLHIRAEWLVTGEPPMFQSDKERKLHERLGQVRASTAKANREGLTGEQQALLQALLFAVETNDVQALGRLLLTLSPEEQTVLAGLRQLDARGRTAVLGLVGSLTSSGPEPQKGARQVFRGPVGQVLGDEAINMGPVTVHGEKSSRKK